MSKSMIVVDETACRVEVENWWPEARRPPVPTDPRFTVKLRGPAEDRTDFTRNMASAVEVAACCRGCPGNNCADHYQNAGAVTPLASTVATRRAFFIQVPQPRRSATTASGVPPDAEGTLFTVTWWCGARPEIGVTL